MMSRGRDELLCDLAETYGIFDYRALPVQTVALLSSGLRDDSRIKTKIAGFQRPIDTLLRAMIVDELRYIRWMQTKDGFEGRNRPSSVFGILQGEDSGRDAVGMTPEEFDRRRLEFMEGGNDG